MLSASRLLSTKMKLTELNPQWIGTGGEGVTDKNGNPVPHRKSVGIEFNCPCGCDLPCFVPFKNPIDGGPGVCADHGWEREGDTFETLTLKPSILRKSGCGWHGFITNGEVINA